MSLSNQIIDAKSSLDVIASGNPERIRRCAERSLREFNEHDPINILMARLASEISERLLGLARIAETEGT